MHTDDTYFLAKRTRALFHSVTRFVAHIWTMRKRKRHGFSCKKHKTMALKPTYNLTDLSDPSDPIEDLTIENRESGPTHITNLPSEIIHIILKILYDDSYPNTKRVVPALSTCRLWRQIGEDTIFVNSRGWQRFNATNGRFVWERVRWSSMINYRARHAIQKTRGDHQIDEWSLKFPLNISFGGGDSDGPEHIIDLFRGKNKEVTTETEKGDRALAAWCQLLENEKEMSSDCTTGKGNDATIS